MKRWIAGILLFLCAYTVFLLVTLPASSVYDYLKKNLMPAHLHQVSGSIWKGHASLLTLNQFHFKDLNWSLAPLNLFVGRLSANIDLKDAKYPLKGQISASLGSTITLSPLKGKLPAAIVPAIARKPDFNLRGDLEINLKSLVLEKNLPREIKGRINLKNATINLPSTIEIGNIQADFTTRNRQIIIQLQDQHAPIGLSGTITLKQDQNYSGKLIFTPTSRSDAGMINLLRNTGTSLQNGKIELQFQGKL